MEDIKTYIEIGKGMGLTGHELSAFVDKRESLAREAEKEKQKIEREERAKEREERMRDKELAQQEKQTLWKLELADKEIELAKLNALKPDIKTKSIESTVKIPKLPPFSDGKDNMDSYLKRFERFATNAKWPKEEWATNLSTLLQGKALDVYSRLSSAEALDYDKLCDALLKRYQLTEEGFRQKFRTSKQEVGETAGQFVVRLTNYLSRWMELGKVSATYEGLKDLILREQFLTVSNRNLVLFLKERKIKTIKEMAELAEQYNEAHPVSDVPFKQFAPNRTNNKSDMFKRDNSDENQQPKTLRERYCFGCGKKDHFIRNCPVRNFSSQGSGTKIASLEIDDSPKHNKEITEEDGESHEGFDETPMTIATCMVFTPTSNIYTLATSQMRIENTGEQKDVEIVNISCQGSGEIVSKSVGSMPVMEGLVGDRKVQVLRDSGCNSALVKESLVKQEEMTNKTVSCVLADGTKRIFPVACIEVNTPFFAGRIDALCMKNPVYDLVLGNIKGVRPPDKPDVRWQPEVKGNEGQTENENGVSSHEVNAVETRAQIQRNKTVKPLSVPCPVLNVSKEEVIKQQKSDETLSGLSLKANSGEIIECSNGSTIQYHWKNEMLYRQFKSPGENSEVSNQLLVPKHLRTKVLQTAHDGVMAGHFGVRKTISKILTEFYWPTLRKDVREYCRSCDICQNTQSKGRVSKLPLGRMPLIDTPFMRVAIDLIGPIHPPTDDGHRFILTVVDYATRYPEATPLKRIDTETVAEALVEIYSRVGVPREVLSDQGKQFTSDLMKEVSRILSISQLTTTPYHPACNGLVERFNGTLKSMLRKLCDEQPKQWNRYIPALLFAYRDTEQDTTGFSPFQLLYGRKVRGPLSILRELWTKEIRDDEIKTTYQYVVDLRERLEDTCKLAKEAVQKNTTKYKLYADSKARDRQFQKGDEVLLLLPDDNNKLLMQWRGPFAVIEKVNQVDYVIRIKGKNKTFHANLLKKYHRRSKVIDDKGSEKSKSSDEAIASVSVIDEADTEGEQDHSYMSMDQNLRVHFPTYIPKESVKDVHINEDLKLECQQQVENLISEFPDVFTDVPGATDLVEHEIIVTSANPIRSKQYPVPFTLKKEIKNEVENMLKLDIIEPTNSPYASPVVMVRKSDGTYRFCCDFRKLNNITVFDAEPIGNPDEIFAKMARGKFFTKIDLSKGYWQIKMKESSKPLTAFVTSEGLFAFKRMPFGLVNSGATFCRMMRVLLKGLESTDNFVDDIIIYTESWLEHLTCLKELLLRLRLAKLTVRPTKCTIGVQSVAFLGHVIGKGVIMPNPEEIKSIINCQRPTTKKQVRALLGLTGYYRKFIPNFSAISSPLSDLTKKGQPSKVQWGPEQETSFHTLINQLSQSPILCLPNFEKDFILQADACETGIGAVLLQEYNGYRFPVYYCSKKLLDRERRYSVIEKECLAIVWAVQKFQNYLYGKEFTLETDHQPLIYLNRTKIANARLMRWALALQPYKFRLESIKGADNVGADFLSRLTM